MDVSSARALGLAASLQQAEVRAFVPETVQLIGYNEAVYPFCGDGRSLCTVPQDWVVDVDQIGWDDWFWLQEYDRFVDTRESYTSVFGERRTD